ncbi:serine/threonine-protein phosphatase [Streptomyces sp. A7024]|uniref:Serine/threonine-protein phosphatase n=1 Tax=Streptomyces coryli TaxID=1128680 RepID=A0A6G4UB90_9ACTN|nr:PP2C family protein-serine/threonine phosphatase [Streptomyces coryli]NGN68980.1 serine/threonine-protein phosphatase [Streptomyces coryli]
MNGLSAAERELRAVAAHRLTDVVTEALTANYGATRVEVRLADYGVRSLQLVEAVPLTADPVSLYDTSQGRAFVAPEPVVIEDQDTDTVTAHLPVGVRGDRAGVLSATFPRTADVRGLLPELTCLCEALGHEIIVADRDTDLYFLARRTARLTLAAEMQWQLLPGRSCRRPEFALGAHLEPAYDIRGDNFDWSASADHLMLAVTNGMGEGINAAMLTSLAVNAMRNARRAGLGLADQAALADQALYGQYQGTEYVAMLLLRFELATGEVEVVEAGSPRAWLLRDGTVERLQFDSQLPLGMFEDTPYTGERISVRPGDRLLLASDGVYETASHTGEAFGERALARSLIDNRQLPAAQVPRTVLRELAEYRGSRAIDDALVACVDWYGAP